ncbi:hypothetical protein LF41_2423 [Lysobacter dokdonensis DS-58]|uniref:Uncharacterized protein n=1 Tax=Lysobacter dokdonensis DS-58 TaxID=1300345 RepID=A0A0A2WIA1_9GAMM|nr:hypothetical protein [Lysobacter dokdonensis]KGQ19916.1 hypothetical protein LF41_2423 [Lysobacter dokdonensis DS-58]
MAAKIEIESSETTDLQGFLSHLAGSHPAKSESEYEHWLLDNSAAFLSCLGYTASHIRRNAPLRGTSTRPDWVIEGDDFVAIFEMKHKRAGLPYPGCTYQTSGLGQLLMYGAAARALGKRVRLYLVDSHIHTETVDTVLAYGLPVTLVEASEEKIAVLYGPQ